MPLIQGEAMWAQVQKLDKYGNWVTDLVITEEDAKRLQNEGVGHILLDGNKQPRMYNGKPVAKFKRPGKLFGDKPNQPPIIIDADEAPFSDLIGNGSKVLVQYHTQKYSQPKPGIKAVLDGVQVLDLVPYGTPVSEFSKVQGGYSQATEQAMEEEFQPE